MTRCALPVFPGVFQLQAVAAAPAFWRRIVRWWGNLGGCCAACSVFLPGWARTVRSLRFIRLAAARLPLTWHPGALEGSVLCSPLLKVGAPLRAQTRAQGPVAAGSRTLRRPGEGQFDPGSGLRLSLRSRCRQCGPVACPNRAVHPEMAWLDAPAPQTPLWGCGGLCVDRALPSFCAAAGGTEARFRSALLRRPPAGSGEWLCSVNGWSSRTAPQGCVGERCLRQSRAAAGSGFRVAVVLRLRHSRCERWTRRGRWLR